MSILRTLLVSALLACASNSFAQTSGNLTGTAATYTYSTAPWVITSGPGTYPDGGGVATFNPITSPIPGTLLASSTITLDVSPTLSQLAFNTPLQYILATAAGQSIVAATTGLTLNTIATAQNVAIGGIPTSIAFGSQITGVISGGGTAGLTKTGSGNIVLAGANTYTGGTHFNGGYTIISSTAAVGDGVFGATGAGNGLSFNGGTVLFNTTGGLTTNRDIFLDAGGATMVNNTATTLGGVISGAGSLTQLAFASTAPALTLTGANTYTGATIIRSGNNSTGNTIPSLVSTTLSGNGSIASSSSYDLMGNFTLSNTATNNTNRLSDTAAMTVRGVNFVSTGNASAASSETIGAVSLANGNSTFLVTPGASASNSLTMASLTRQNNSTLTLRGTNLGNAPANGVANIYATAAPGLVGGAGAAGSTTLSILPYAVGNNTSSTAFTAAGLVNSSFVTYGADGFRPLAAAEYAAAFGGSPLDNVRLTATTAAGAGVTANAVLFQPAAAATLSGGPINITSGAFLYSPSTNVTGTVSAGLNFGTAEGIISNTSLLNVSGILSGSNGLTLNTVFPPTSTFTPSLTLTGANTYTGNTTINSGIIGYSGTIADGTPGSFGTGGAGSAIILNAGTNVAGISAGALSTVNRDISVIGNGPNYLSASASGFITTFNGNISLGGNLNIYAFTNAAASAFNFNGVISGPGSIKDVADTFGVFNGNNTYSGGTTLAASSYFAGSDTAFGTGTIAINGTGLLSGAGTTARTLANNFLLNSTGGFGGTAPLTLTGSVDLNGSRSLTVSNTALTTLTGAVTNGSLTKTGTGAIAFNSATGNPFTGGFVNTGTAANSTAIYINNTSGSGLGAGGVSIGGSSATVYSTLAGNFSTSGAVSIGGRVSPGNGTGLTAATAGSNSIGLENFGSTLTLSSSTTSSALFELASTSSFDRITVAGAFTLNGTINVTTIGGFTAQPGDTFDLADWGSIVVGTYTVNTSGAAANGTWDTSNFATNGTITVLVPEPSTWAMLALGLGSLTGLMRFRRR